MSPMQSGAGLRERKKLETRQSILKTAKQLFYERGFEPTTLEDIAEGAGVHKQTVLRYFGSKDEIALAFRYTGLRRFQRGLLDAERNISVVEYWRKFIEESASEIVRRGDIIPYAKLVDSEPALAAASLSIQMQYEALMAAALSREAGVDPAHDIYGRLLAALLVGGNFSIARMVLETGRSDELVSAAVSVVDFVSQKFPARDSGAPLSERAVPSAELTASDS